MQLTDQPTPTQGSGLRTPLRVQNLEPNTTVFAKQINGDPLRVQWAAKGHSGDTQRVPLALVEDIEFLNSLEAGVLKVVSGPADVLADLQFETEQVRAERAEAEANSKSVIDRKQDRDIMGATCIGPAPAGRNGECNRSIIQSAKQQGEIPPLCEQHIHLATNFYLAEAGSRGENATEDRDGVVRRNWRPVTVTDRQKQ